MFTWNPYISAGKCINISETHLLDNGKLISAKRIRICVTEIDLILILEQYDFEWCAIMRCMQAFKRPLPAWFIDTMRKWYIDKTQLKGAETYTEKRRYMESKQRLNAIYGMTATAWARDKYDYDFAAQNWKEPECKTDLAGIEQEIEKMKKPNSRAFLPYIGLYVTAYARQRLFRVAECCGTPLYCDTDSVKGCDWDLDALEAYNADLRKKSDVSGFTIADRKGILHPIGVFEEEKPYVRFCALHAKCYAGEQINSKTGLLELHATIAGVTDDNGYQEDDPRRITKEDEIDKLENLQDGLKFYACGGVRSVYKCQEHDIILDGDNIHSYGGCAILNTTYEIGGTNDLLAMYAISDTANPYK